MTGKIIIISSPSGAGKTSITHELLSKNDNFRLSISTTTRKKRLTEIEGRDYFFLEKEEFKRSVQDGQFLESAEVYGNFYGTPKGFVKGRLENGRDIVFDIDWQGARSLREHREFDIISIFILPPSLKALEQRLISRGLDSEEVIQERMKRAKSEIGHYKEYDHVVINEDFHVATQEILDVVAAKIDIREPAIFDDFVADLLGG